MKSKKHIQLGMNPSTASGRLVKDILFKYIMESGHNKCFRCKKEMCRDTFSIEHIEDWLDSENPVGLFFDLENISFSHKVCNTKASRSNKKIFTEKEKRSAEKKYRKKYSDSLTKEEKQKRRKERYERTRT